jgi:tight adherence protein C
MGSAELTLIAGILMMGAAMYLMASNLLASNADAQALSWATGEEPVKSKSGIINLSRPLVHQLTLKYAQRVQNERYRKKIAQKLLSSGLSRELNVDEFIGLKILWGLAFPIFLLFLNFALDLGLPVPLCILLGVLGFIFPDTHANAAKKQRYTSVIVDLPFFLDLLALSTAAGLDFMGAIQRITEKTHGSVLGEELELVLRDIKLGSSRAEALRALANRLEIGEITSFVNVIVDADATGASIATVLKDQSQQMRLERFVRAEKAGARASQMILLPMMVFTIPAVFLTVFGPVALQFMFGK